MPAPGLKHAGIIAKMKPVSTFFWEKRMKIGV